MADFWKELIRVVQATGGASWNGSSDALKKAAWEYVLKWATGSNETLKKAIDAALKDNALTKGEATGLLALMLKGWKKNPFLGDPYVQKLLGHLQDGTLDTQEIVGVAALWVSDNVQDNRLQRLLLALKDGRLDQQDLKDALDSWLTRIGETDLKKKLDDLIDSPTSFLGNAELLLLAGAWLIQDKKVAAVPDAVNAQLSALKNALNQLAKSDLVGALKAIADKDTPKAVRLILSKIGIQTTDSMVRAVLDGQIDAAAQEFLTGVFKRSINNITAAQASDLAKTVIRMLKGELSLIPVLDEKQDFFQRFEMKPDGIINDPLCPMSEYELFGIVRRVLFASQRAVQTGSAVSTGAQARPNSFIMASIQPDTPVKRLLADMGKRDQFLDFLAIACLQEFQHLPNGERFGERLVLTPQQFNQGETALDCMVHVADFLLA
jgi:hypothetical protein